MNRIGYLWLFLWLFPLPASQDHYYKVSVYGGLIHGLLLEYLCSKPEVTTSEARHYLNNKACATVFADALNMGYSKRSVIKSCYHTALGQRPTNDIMIDALNQEMRGYQMRKDFHYWCTTSFTAFCALVNLFSIGFYIVYFSKDRKAIKHYMQGGYSVFLSPYANTP